MAQKDSFGKAYKSGKAEITGAVFNLVVVVVVIVIAIVMYRLYKAAKSGATAVGDTLGDAIIAQQTGMPVQRIKVCREVANNLVNAIQTKVWFIEDVDEEAFINELNRLVAGNEAQLVAQFFKEQKPHGLKSYINDAFSEGEKARLKPFIYTNIY